MSSKWQKVTVEEIAADHASALATGPFGSSISAKYFQESGVPVIRGSNLSADVAVRLNEQGLVFLTTEKAGEFKRSTVTRGDLVFTCWGTINQVGFIDRRSRYDCYVISNKQMKLTVDPLKVDARFIYYVFSGPKKQAEIVDNGIGSSVPGFNLSQFRRHELLLPALHEQASIADFLDTFDDRICLLSETNSTLEAMAQAMFKSWFVDFDPVRAKLDGRVPEGMDEATAALFPATFDESEIGMVPKGWRVTTLGSICKDSGGAIQTGPFGSQLHASDYLDIGVPVVMPQDLAGRRVQVEKIARVGDDDVRRLSRHWLRTGDIVFSRRGDVGRHALVGVRESGWLCGTGCLLVRPGQSWPSATYLSLALDRADAKEWLLRHAVGATMPNLNTGILSAVPIMRPDDLILRAFDEIVCRLDDRISHGHANIRALVELRDTLLPRLISGQLRLPEAETVFEKAAA